MDPGRLHAWLAARSIARGLPPPVSEPGGFRVEEGRRLYATLGWRTVSPYVIASIPDA